MRAFLIALVLALATAVPVFADGGGNYEAPAGPIAEIGAPDTQAN
jgi:hypothetical protein